MKQGPWQARGDFTAMLDALSMLIADGGRAATGLKSRRPLPEILARPGTLQALVAAQGSVTATREAAQGNVNPQLLLAALADDLAEAL